VVEAAHALDERLGQTADGGGVVGAGRQRQQLAHQRPQPAQRRDARVDGAPRRRHPVLDRLSGRVLKVAQQLQQSATLHQNIKKTSK